MQRALPAPYTRIPPPACVAILFTNIRHGLRMWYRNFPAGIFCSIEYNFYCCYIGGQVLSTYNTGDLPIEESRIWKQFGSTFITPPNANAVAISFPRRPRFWLRQRLCGWWYYTEYVWSKTNSYAGWYSAGWKCLQDINGATSLYLCNSSQQSSQVNIIPKWPIH